ncbi:rho GTPase-activating protein gacII isoform X2 [Drosophila subpulchrella]|uniref:rho GTPase-activating protein gacII isoform X2 n=1 Tax=Drosophila subpulchrella TaxID=1486046 RepID=UPI0018A167CB|nr:rho GTPase-activating protein gacII isoform X2 [Drosophila subpulchrella]
MCRREVRGPAFMAFLSVIATMMGLVQGQQPVMSLPLDESTPQQRLPPSYVKGVLSLKSSLLSNKPALGYGSNQQQVENSVPVAGIRPGMRYTPQLDVQQPQSPQSQQPVHQEIQMPPVKMSRYNQEFPAAHLFQPPFVPLPKKQESQDAPPTAEQLELLQQLSEFFGQRQQGQQQVQHVQQQEVMNCGTQMDQNEGKGLGICDVESTTDCCDTTKEPNKNEEEDSVSVDVKNKEPQETTTTTARPKPPVAAKTKATKPSITKTTTHKPQTTRTTKGTTIKLPCCPKPRNQGIAESPNVISFSLNIQNDNAEQAKSLQQLPRSGRHVIQPDLRINAITNLLRYRRKIAHGIAPYPKPFSLLKDQETQIQIRTKRKKDKILDKKQLLQAELKIWPISIRSKLVERLH